MAVADRDENNDMQHDCADACMQYWEKKKLLHKRMRIDFSQDLFFVIFC